MTFFADLTPYEYDGNEPDPMILNIGWLSADCACPKGEPNAHFVAALKRLVADPVNRYRGAHTCDFCPPPPSFMSASGLPILNPPPGTTGNGEIRVAGLGGVTYVAPVLILHYVTEHRYAPPQPFIDAVMATGA